MGPFQHLQSTCALGSWVPSSAGLQTGPGHWQPLLLALKALGQDLDPGLSSATALALDKALSFVAKMESMTDPLSVPPPYSKFLSAGMACLDVPLYNK